MAIPVIQVQVYPVIAVIQVIQALAHRVIAVYQVIADIQALPD